MNSIQDIKNFILNNYNSEDTLGIWYDTGNFDDAYEMGRDHGESIRLYELGKILGLDLESPKWSDH